MLSPARSFRHLGSVLEEHGKAKCASRRSREPTGWAGGGIPRMSDLVSIACPHIYIPTYLPAYLPTCLPAFMHIYKCVYIYIYVYVYIYMYVYIYICMSLYICIYIYNDMKQAYEGTYVHKGKFGGMIMFTISHSYSA